MKRKFIKTSLIILMTLQGNIIPVFAINTNTLIPYIQDDGVQSVNIVDLAKAMKGEVKKVDGGLEMFLNNKSIKIYDNDSTIYINGGAVPYKTTKAKDFTTGEYYDMAIYHKPTKSGDGYLIPKTIIQDSIGIKCDSDGIHVDESEAEQSTEQTAKYNGGNGSLREDLIPDSSLNNGVDSVSNGYTPVYDYDLTDYIDAYIFKHDISKITYDENLANMLSEKMNAERQATINEGWHTKDGKFYFLKEGVPITGWYEDHIIWYYFNSDGSMKTGWLNDKGNWYYFYDSGAMAQKVSVNGYYLNEYGALTNNVPAKHPTGIAYKELVNRVRKLGYSHKTIFEADDPYNTSKAAGYEFEWYSSRAGQSISFLTIRDNYTLSLSAGYDPDSPEYNKNIYQMLKWLLPTQIDEVYAKINANPQKPQTIYADGRIVDVSFHQFGIDFNVRD